jgi:hypothetical protein
MRAHTRAPIVLLATVGAISSLTACSNEPSDEANLFAYVNELRQERGAEPWPSTNDPNFQAYLQSTRDDCGSNFQRESTFERLYVEDGEDAAEAYRDRLAVLCPEEALTLHAPDEGAPTTSAGGALPVTAPTIPGPTP